jgi:hypothetical protein
MPRRTVNGKVLVNNFPVKLLDQFHAFGGISPRYYKHLWASLLCSVA